MVLNILLNIRYDFSDKIKYKKRRENKRDHYDNYIYPNRDKLRKLINATFPDFIREITSVKKSLNNADQIAIEKKYPMISKILAPPTLKIYNSIVSRISEIKSGNSIGTRLLKTFGFATISVPLCIFLGIAQIGVIIPLICLAKVTEVLIQICTIPGIDHLLSLIINIFRFSFLDRTGGTDSVMYSYNYFIDIIHLVNIGIKNMNVKYRTFDIIFNAQLDLLSSTYESKEGAHQKNIYKEKINIIETHFEKVFTIIDNNDSLLKEIFDIDTNIFILRRNFVTRSVFGLVKSYDNLANHRWVVAQIFSSDLLREQYIIYFLRELISRFINSASDPRVQNLMSKEKEINEKRLKKINKWIQDYEFDKMKVLIAKDTIEKTETLLQNSANEKEKVIDELNKRKKDIYNYVVNVQFETPKEEIIHTLKHHASVNRIKKRILRDIIVNEIVEVNFGIKGIKNMEGGTDKNKNKLMNRLESKIIKGEQINNQKTNGIYNNDKYFDYENKIMKIYDFFSDYLTKKNYKTYTLPKPPNENKILYSTIKNKLNKKLALHNNNISKRINNAERKKRSIIKELEIKSKEGTLLEQLENYIKKTKQ